MKDEPVRDLARERLLSAELAELFDTDLAQLEVLGAGPQRRHGPWLAAALLCLGATVAFGVAWLRRHDDAAAAQGKFDPLDPWWEQERYPTFRVPEVVVTTPEQVAALPAAVARITVSTREAQDGTIEAVLRRSGLRQLLLVHGDAQVAARVPWPSLAAQRSLRSLGCHALPVAADWLRSLQPWPELRSLALPNGSVRLDAATATALAGIRTLRHLDLAYDELEPEGLLRLAALPELDTLVLGVPPRQQPDLRANFAAVAQIRSLRALFCDGDFEPMPAEALRELHRLERLVALQLTNFQIDDEGLEALPRTLEHLALPTLAGVTARGLAGLAERSTLRSLACHLPIPAELDAAVVALVAKLPLECFECRNSVPSAPLWAELAGSPVLRRIAVGLERGEMPTAVFERALGCRSLVVLWVSLATLPTPQQLGVLREHPALRRIVLRRTAPDVVPTPAELAALRASVRAEVEVL
jgi:hypothetical protein